MKEMHEMIMNPFLAEIICKAKQDLRMLRETTGGSVCTLYEHTAGSCQRYLEMRSSRILAMGKSQRRYM